MRLPEAEREQLSKYMISASKKIKDKFKIVSENERVLSFQGEAIVVKAVKH